MRKFKNNLLIIYFEILLFYQPLFLFHDFNHVCLVVQIKRNVRFIANFTQVKKLLFLNKELLYA